ncbi:hypothetical protein [Spiroplasma floricola]|uniref:Uncharacterized protein n=1 Tax=Spiroplasma floricola 23-6 TaxID=1336749 RepID=A0A2K8SD96_9MOLU|nr:hypothetical protein [Spiroplasma floricola]AUB31426.1 hypothetical protein SFLOR_v1c03690 [Spiroplasma floricola 23-6]
MSEKIKVLKIKKSLQDEIEETTLDFPSKGIWYEENSNESISLDFDKTISFKENKTSKIDLVQNANSHFFTPNNQTNLNFNKSDIENKTFESINLVDKMIKPKNSNIRKEIINMRILSYEKEQKDKEFLLNKLNVDLKPHNNFKNYNLAKKENNFKYIDSKIVNNSLEAKINNLEKQIFSINKQLLKNSENKNEFEVSKILKQLKNQSSTNSNLNSSSDSKEKFEKKGFNKSVLEPVIKIGSQKTNEPRFNSNYVKTFEKVKEIKSNDKNLINAKEKNQNKELENKEKNINMEKNITVKFNDKSHKQNNDKSLMNQINKKTLYNEMNTEELKTFIKKENNNYSIPVVNNLDYTLANTIDDLEKAIRNLELEKKKIKEIFFDETGETTELLESLQRNAKRNKKSSSLNTSIDFDSFENWYDNSNDVKKLAKLAKKENKKMKK